MDQNVIELLKGGGVGILPTDTLYGLVGRALSKKTVERIYRLKRRAPDKPFIVLISSLKDLNLFRIRIDQETSRFLNKIWPNPVSVVLPSEDEEFSYLHRGTKTLAFRIPKDKELQVLLQQTGPLVAPSANPEGKPPAETINRAKKYFDQEADFFQNGGPISSLPSTLIRIENDEITVLREGAYELPDLTL